MSFSGAEGEEFDPEQFIQKFSSVFMSIAKILFPLAAIARLATLSPHTMFGDFPVGAGCRDKRCGLYCVSRCSCGYRAAGFVRSLQTRCAQYA